MYDDILALYGEMEQSGKAEVTREADEPCEPEFTVKVTPFEREGSNILGLAHVVLDDSFQIGNISVLKGKDGEFVAMPSHKTDKTGKGGKAVYQDVCYPITKEFREKLNEAVLDTYHQEREKAMEQGQERATQQVQTDSRGFMQYSGEQLPFR